MPRKKRKIQKPNGVYMPKRTEKKVSRKKKILRKVKKRKRPRKHSKKLSGIVLTVLIILITGSLIFLSIKFITKLRATDSEYELEYVIGLQNIPAYPGSEFIFEINMDDPAISTFLSSGNSAYRVSSRVKILDVFKFYDAELPKNEWVKVLSVEIGSDDKKDGEYWIKDGKGLRIYSKFNDVWYETITEEEANSGLTNRVKEEIEREMILANSEAQDLLPDFPWLLKIPKEYLIKYSSGSFEDLRQASFKKIGSTEEVIIAPIGYTGAKELDYFLRDYLDTFEDSTTGVVNVFVIPKPGLRGMVNIDNENNLVAILPNYYNNVVYVIHCNSNESPFFEYVLSNIEEQDSSTY